MTATENLAPATELALDVGIGDDGPFPAVVTLAYCMVDPIGPCPPSARHYPRWNGWLAEPRFDRATVDAIAAMLDRDRAAGFESDLLTWNADESVTLTRPTEPDWSGEIITPDADGRYTIGAYGWCWYEWDEGMVRE